MFNSISLCNWSFKTISIYVKLAEKDEEKNEDIKKKIEKNFDLSPRGIRELLV